MVMVAESKGMAPLLIHLQQDILGLLTLHAGMDIPALWCVTKHVAQLGQRVEIVLLELVEALCKHEGVLTHRVQQRRRVVRGVLAGAPAPQRNTKSDEPTVGVCNGVPNLGRTVKPHAERCH